MCVKEELAGDKRIQKLGNVSTPPTPLERARRRERGFVQGEVMGIAERCPYFALAYIECLRELGSVRRWGLRGLRRWNRWNFGMMVSASLQGLPQVGDPYPYLISFNLFTGHQSDESPPNKIFRALCAVICLASGTKIPTSPLHTANRLSEIVLTGQRPFQSARQQSKSY